MSSAQRDKPDTPTISNGQSISMYNKVNYLGVMVDRALRLEEHVQSIVTTAEQRILYLSTPPLATMLFESFIVSLLTYFHRATIPSSLDQWRTKIVHSPIEIKIKVYIPATGVFLFFSMSYDSDLPILQH